MNNVNENIKVQCNLITKEYCMEKTKSARLKAMLMNSKNGIASFWSLKGVSFTAYSGDTIGIIGINGSGKSTLARIIGGLTIPSSGELKVNGEATTISIGAGLRGELTGRENIFLKGLMSGMTKKEIQSKVSTIIEFSELGEFIDQPVKSYSSGMKSRLGFAIAVHRDADILIIDEALAVGDETFYKKCVDKMMEFKKRGNTIFFISHSMGQVEKLCDQVIWIHYGELMDFGDSRTVIKKYQTFTANFKKLSKPEKENYQKNMKLRQKNFTLKKLFDKESATLETVGELSRQSKNKLSTLITLNPVGSNMTLATKFLVIALLLTILFLSVISIKEVSLVGMVKNFLFHH
ncbi:ABC transporter ATP-binding protein [Carnobacterium gallinarum]|uniref:ABC transporter ATP-binding protein n=1 Tax=Carnobacterium gallinarum TaxID=2749 RepID=UPI000554E7C5|nr:ABC transporter ATP-binding protein [Carnobacterium gallinarum]